MIGYFVFILQGIALFLVAGLLALFGGRYIADAMGFDKNGEMFMQFGVFMAVVVAAGWLYERRGQINGGEPEVSLEQQERFIDDFADWLASEQEGPIPHPPRQIEAALRQVLEGEEDQNYRAALIDVLKALTAYEQVSEIEAEIANKLRTFPDLAKSSAVKKFLEKKSQ